MRYILSVLIFCFAQYANLVHAETGVSRSVFTTAIINKEPVSDQLEITTETTRVYFFTELLGLNGHTITHRWKYNNQVMAEVSFDIAAYRWRTWSSKSLLASWTGNWQVDVLDEGGNIIEQKSFNYIAAQAESAIIEMDAQPADNGANLKQSGINQSSDGQNKNSQSSDKQTGEDLEKNASDTDVNSVD